MDGSTGTSNADQEEKKDGSRANIGTMKQLSTPPVTNAQSKRKQIQQMFDEFMADSLDSDSETGFSWIGLTPPLISNKVSKSDAAVAYAKQVVNNIPPQYSTPPVHPTFSTPSTKVICPSTDDGTANKKRKSGRPDLRPRPGNQVAPMVVGHGVFDGKRFDKKLKKGGRYTKKLNSPPTNPHKILYLDSEDNDAAVYDQLDHIKLERHHTNIEKHGHPLKYPDDDY
jgi:hypothetical protein